MHAVLDEQQPGRFVLALHGEFDLATEQTYSEALADVLGREQVGELQVDLADVPFLDSTGVRALLRTRREVAERGGAFRVRQPNDQVAQVLRVAAVDQLLDIRREPEP